MRNENTAINSVNRRTFLEIVGWFVGSKIFTESPLELLAIDESFESKRGAFSNTLQVPSLDSVLEGRIIGYETSLRERRILTRNDRLSVTVQDIPHDNKLVDINGNSTRMSASTIKNYVMLALFHEVDAGSVTYTQRIRGLVESMISYNRGLNHANNSFNLLVDMIGMEKINEIIKLYGFRHTKIVEKIPPNERTYNNTTSSNDLNTFYNLLWHNELPYHQEMKRVLSIDKRERLVDGTCIPKNVARYTKSGAVHGMVADSGIVVMKDAKGKDYPYAIIVMVEDKTRPNSNDSITRRISWRRRRTEIIRDISEGVYDYLHQTHLGKPYICTQHNGRHLGGRQ